MAKKITIEGEGFLTSLSQDWGGVNNEDHAVNIYGTLVPAGAEWGVNRGEIERFMKAQYGTKVGDVRWYKPDGSTYYSLLGFATKADALAWDADHTSREPIFTHQLDISTIQSDSYTCSLHTSKVSSTSALPYIVQYGNDYIIPFRLEAWQISAADSSRTFIPATGQLVIERSTGQSFVPVATLPIDSQQTTDDFRSPINVGSYLTTGGDSPVTLRFRVQNLPYTDSEGNENYMTSNAIVIYFQTVSLSVSMPTDEWQFPKYVDAGVFNLQGNNQLNFKFTGNVFKTLHVKYSTKEGNWLPTIYEVSNIETLQTSISIIDSNGNLGVTSSGVHSIEAWATCDNNDGGELESEHIHHQIMIVKADDLENALKRWILIQNPRSPIDNFVQSAICDYILWNPKQNPDSSITNDTSVDIQCEFIVTNSPIMSGSYEEYLVLPVLVTPGRITTLSGTLEIESAEFSPSYNTYMHAFDSDNTDLLQQAQEILVDNTSGFQPVAGAYFQLNPKVRNNGEANAQSIINYKDPANSPSSEWYNFKMDDSDGYTTDSDGNKCLLIPAGRLLNINYNPFDWYYTDHQDGKSLTINIKYKTFNITNEQDPIFKIGQLQQDPDNNREYYLGLCINPLNGTMVSALSGGAEGTTDFRWAEDRMEDLTITVTPYVEPNEFDECLHREVDNPVAHGSINLVRVYINGVIERELKYNPEDPNQFCNPSLFPDGASMVIGQVGQNGRDSGADIAIYGIRVYRTGLQPNQVIQNYISALYTSEEKIQEKSKNDILKSDGTGRLSLDKCLDKGYNSYIIHCGDNYYGDMPFADSDSKKGWLEVKRYSYEGTYLPEYSGTFCKASKNLKFKGQGTTAMTYYYWNIQCKLQDVTNTIELSLDQIHPSIHLAAPRLVNDAWVVAIYGGCLGKDYPIGDKTKDYPCTVNDNNEIVTVTLPDGWIDGNGLYRGQCWQVGPDKPLSQKLVLKINYASSMQSHLIGVNWMYDALHTLYCGYNSMQRDTAGRGLAEVAKQVVPMLVFTVGKNITDESETRQNAVYQGPGGFGPGKMDKPTWGYNKNASVIDNPDNPHYRPFGQHYFAMFEGAANNTILSDFLAPFDDQDHILPDDSVQPAKVKYFLQDPVNPGTAKDPESFFYRHTDALGNNAWEKGLGFDAGETGPSDATPEMPAPASDSPADAPSCKITKILRDAWNYVYLHNPNINFFSGTFNEFKAASHTDAEMKQKWVCVVAYETSDNYLVKRYDFCQREWVNAGLWDFENRRYESIDIRLMPGMDFDDMTPQQKASEYVVNKYKSLLMQEAYPTETNLGIAKYFKPASLKFHYSFINLFIAGTDNCSKNTYYVIDPVPDENGNIRFELHQDDVDTVLATDNHGYQSKPYYIDRTHPYSGELYLEYVTGTDNVIYVTRRGTAPIVGDFINVTSNENVGATITAISETVITVSGESRNVWALTLSYSWEPLTLGTLIAVNIDVRSTIIDPVDTVYSGYDGMQNGLFDLVEALWLNDEGHSIAITMGNVFDRMMDIINGGIGSSESDTQSGIWKVLNRHLFDIQRYIPKVAYNEAARIRYEFPEMIGYQGGRAEKPIAQSMGDQLESEIQFLTRRLIYFASYSAYGDFAASIGSGNSPLGIEDVTSTFSVPVVPLPDGHSPVYTFHLRPHQYIYPSFYQQTDYKPTYRRVSPNQVLDWTIDTVSTNGYHLVLPAINYYNSIGNIGDFSAMDTAWGLDLVGSRLTELLAVPTRYYPTTTTQEDLSITAEEYNQLSDADKTGYAPAFRPVNVTVPNRFPAVRVRELSLKGCKTISHTEAIPLNISSLTTIGNLDLRGTSIRYVILPQTSTLNSVLLPALTVRIEAMNLQNLSTLTAEGYKAVANVRITDCPALNVRNIVLNLWQAQTTDGATTVLNSLTVQDIDWVDFNVAALSWLADLTNCNFLLKNNQFNQITILESQGQYNMTFDLKNKFLAKWGNVDDINSREFQGLRINYNVYALTRVTVRGNFYVEAGDTFPFYINPNDLRCNNQTKILWAIAVPPTYQATRVEIGATTGILTVEHLSDIQDFIAIGGYVSTYDRASDSYDQISATKQIEIWNRPAQLGDVVFHDGTFCDPDTYDGEKIPIGVCVFRAPRHSDGSIVSELFHPDDKQTRLMVALENVIGRDGNTTYSAWQWGNYYNSGGATSSTDITNSAGTRLSIPGILSTTYFYDIQSIINYSTGGRSATSANTFSGENPSELEQLADYFKLYSPLDSFGDGAVGGSDSTSPYYDANIGSRTLTESLANLAPTTYHAGDIVNSGFAKTLKIIEQRNKILDNGFVYRPGDDTANPPISEIKVLPHPRPTANPAQNFTELQSLTREMAAFRVEVRTLLGETTNYVKWSQIYFPAASACYAYEPSVGSGYTLADKFKAHNWFLPAPAILARMRAMFGATGDYASRNIFTKLVNAGIGPARFFTESVYWSSAESYALSAWGVGFITSSSSVYGNSKYYTGYVVRAVAAF